MTPAILAWPLDLNEPGKREIARNDVIRLSLDTIIAGIGLHRAHSLSFRDALIGQAAIAGACNVLLSEDMQHESRYDGVVVHNPFIA